MIELKLINPQWIKGKKDDPEDQCAHGYIKFEIDELVISNADEEWTVSAAALFLLRTVSNDHTLKSSVAEYNYLIPCCGFNPFKGDGDFNLILMGCNSGLNPDIIHNNGDVSISFEGQSRTISLSEWAQAVVSFTDQVLDFYTSSAPKFALQDKHDKEGWRLFWEEIKDRKLQASNIASNS